MKERLSYGLMWTGMGFLGMTIGQVTLAVNLARKASLFDPVSVPLNVPAELLLIVMFLGVAAGTFVGMIIWALLGFGAGVILYGPAHLYERWLDKVIPVKPSMPVATETPTP